MIETFSYKRTPPGINSIKYVLEDDVLTICACGIKIATHRGRIAKTTFDRVKQKTAKNRPIEEVMEIAAIVCGVTVDEMKSVTRKARIVFARWLVWHYCVDVKYPTEIHTYRDIANIFGMQMNHSNIFHAIATMKNERYGWRKECIKKFWEAVDN